MRAERPVARSAWLPLLVLAMTLGSAAAEEPAHRYAAYEGLPSVQPKLGEEKKLGGLLIKLVKIDDQRSYAGTWSGPAFVTVQVQSAGHSAEYLLHFWDMVYPSTPEEKSRQGGLGNTVAVGSQQLFLASLAPWSSGLEKVRPEQYVATFLIDTVADYQRKRKAIDAAQAELKKRVGPNHAYFPTGLQTDVSRDFTITFDILFRPAHGKIQVTVDGAGERILAFRKL